MKTTTSSKSLFSSTLFTFATLLAVAAMTGCGAAPGDERTEESGEHLDNEHLGTKKVLVDKDAVLDLESVTAPSGMAGGGGGAGGVGGGNAPAKKQTAE